MTLLHLAYPPETIRMPVSVTPPQRGCDNRRVPVRGSTRTRSSCRSAMKHGSNPSPAAARVASTWTKTFVDVTDSRMAGAKPVAESLTTGHQPPGRDHHRPQTRGRGLDGGHRRRVVRVLPLRHRSHAGVQQDLLLGDHQRAQRDFFAFATYAVGFVARPLGGVVFGHFGDKYGRKKLLQFSLLLVGVATFAMGCLPTYGQIGYWAPASESVSFIAS